jgi:hypothetical protein
VRRGGSIRLRSGAGISDAVMKIIERLLNWRIRAAGASSKISDPETTKMITRSLSRRLDRLETSIMPTTTTSDPVVIELKFFSPEKVVTSSMSSGSISLRRHPRKGRVGDEGYR